MFASPGNFFADEDGFSVPNHGGTLAVRHARVAFENTDPIIIFTLPQGAVIVGWLVNVREGFNDTSTDVLDIGTVGTDDAYAADLDVSAAGQINTGFVESELFADPLAEDTPVTAKYTGGDEDADAGSADIAAFYILM